MLCCLLICFVDVDLDSQACQQLDELSSFLLHCFFAVVEDEDVVHIPDDVDVVLATMGEDWVAEAVGPEWAAFEAEG